MRLQDYHAFVRSTVSPRLRSYAPVITTFLSNNISLASIITAALIDNTLHGKMNRSLLSFLAYDGYNTKKNPILTDIACALEITHTAYLIQDDVMDNDKIRRGKDALFIQLKKQYRAHIDNDDQLYKYLAICIGDAGFHFANYCLSNTPDAIRKTIHEIFFLTDCGQYEDLLNSRLNTFPDEREIESIYRQKTGNYTIGLPIRIGMLLADAPKEDVRVMDHIAQILGLIYQITDDELNLIGDPNKTGKPRGSDIVESKRTIHITRLFSLLPKHESKQLMKIFQKNNKTETEINAIIEAMHTHKVFDTLRNENMKRYDRALSLLQKVHMNPIHKELFQEFAQGLLSRTA